MTRWTKVLSSGSYVRYDSSFIAPAVLSWGGGRERLSPGRTSQPTIYCCGLHACWRSLRKHGVALPVTRREETYLYRERTLGVLLKPLRLDFSLACSLRRHRSLPFLDFRLACSLKIQFNTFNPLYLLSMEKLTAVLSRNASGNAVVVMRLSSKLLRVQIYLPPVFLDERRETLCYGGLGKLDVNQHSSSCFKLVGKYHVCIIKKKV